MIGTVNNNEFSLPGDFLLQVFQINGEVFSQFIGDSQTIVEFGNSLIN